MREHLYKAKNLETGEWAFGSLVDDTYIMTEKQARCFDVDGWYQGQLTEIDPETVCEYTGWEFNGVKAFENDTVESEYGTGVIKFGEYETIIKEGEYYILYTVTGLHIEYENGDTVLPDTSHMDYFMVTGNIYDNTMKL